MARIITFSNQKGGVAKSTTAEAFAAELTARGFRVLMVDMDAQPGNLSLHVGADKARKGSGDMLLLAKPTEGSVSDCIQDAGGFGDIVAAENAVQHDADTSPLGDPVGYVSGLPDVYIPADRTLSGLISRAAENAGLRHVRANITTGDQFIADLEKKKWLASHFGAGACDMEGGAVAQVCLEYNTPYAAFRSVSDTLTGNGKEYEENVHTACAASAALLTALLLLLPA